MRVSRRVGYRAEMRRSKRHLDRQIDRLLAGEPNPEIGERIAELVTRLQTESDSRVSGNGLAATLATEVREAESVPARARHRTGKPLPTRWRRRIMLSTFLSSLLGKLAIGAVALASTAGGLAATGNLPDPVQEWTAERLGAVGIEIPGPDEAADDTAKDVIDVIEGGDPYEGEGFGQDVADTASDGKSSKGLDSAEDRADNAADEADNAEVEIPDPEDLEDAYRP